VECVSLSVRWKGSGSHGFNPGAQPPSSPNDCRTGSRAGPRLADHPGGGSGDGDTSRCRFSSSNVIDAYAGAPRTTSGAAVRTFPSGRKKRASRLRSGPVCARATPAAPSETHWRYGRTRAGLRRAPASSRRRFAAPIDRNSHWFNELAAGLVSIERHGRLRFPGHFSKRKPWHRSSTE